MLARVLFFPSLGINALMTRVTSRRWYDRLDDTVILGALPVKSKIHELIEKDNVKAMVSANEDFELRHLAYSAEVLKSMGIDQLRLRITDLTGTPTQEHILQALDFILAHRKQGNTVYLHCKAGRTRSATIAACYLMKIYSWEPNHALNFLKKKRPQVWLRKKQLSSIELFYETQVRKSS